jgi:hypothetical protein
VCAVVDKAQIFSTDLIFALIIFILILLSTTYLWDYSREKITLSEERNDLEIVARNAMSSLLLKEGNPSNWSDLPIESFNKTIIKNLGLAGNISINGLNRSTSSATAALVNKGSRVLDESKVSRLVELNDEKYSVYKELLAIKGSGYEFALDINVWNGTDYELRNSIGLEPYDNASNIVTIYRYGLLNQSWVHLRMQAWQRCRVIC